jgi:hypothetical protein
MATTTNYGWTTPDDTALVKDGASAIRTLGSSVDTTTKALNPETTLGDIAYRSSTANVKTRLGIGTTGQVLTVAAGVPSWATPASGGAGLNLVNATDFTTASAVAINNVFTSTYENYRVILKLNTVSTAMAVKFNFRVGGTSNTSSNYNYAAYKNTFASASLIAYDVGASVTYFYIGEAVGTFTGSYDVISPQSGTKKFVNGLAVQSAAGYGHQGFYNDTQAFDGFEITLSSGTITGTVYTYGYAK